MGVNKQVKSLGYLSSRYLQITQQTSAGHKGIPVFIRPDMRQWPKPSGGGWAWGCGCGRHTQDTLSSFGQWFWEVDSRSSVWAKHLFSHKADA